MSEEKQEDYSSFDELIKILNNEHPDSLDKVSYLINEFNSKKHKDLSQDYIHEIVDYLSYLYFIITYPFNNLELWRVRSSKCGELFRHIDDLKYPPRNFVSDFGRANIPFSSVFYAASSPETAFAESRLEKDNYFHLTKYNSKNSATLQVIVIGDIDNLRRRKKTVLDISAYADKYNYILNSLTPDIRLAVQLVDAFFVDRLSRKGNQDEYRITSRIINELFESSKYEISGIIYPSVEHAGGYNYAFKPDVYDSYITPVEVSACKVEKNYGYGAYLIVESTPVTVKNQQVLWSDGHYMHAKSI